MRRSLSSARSRSGIVILLTPSATAASAIVAMEPSVAQALVEPAEAAVCRQRPLDDGHGATRSGRLTVV